MPPRFRTTIGPDLREAARAGAAFAQFAQEHAVPEGVRRDVNVALDELLSNAIRHGFEGRKDGAVTLEVELLPDRLAITLTDDGTPFDPLAMDAPDVTLTAEQRQPGGLGVHLVRRLMDDMRYERREGRNVLVMAKRLTGGR